MYMYMCISYIVIVLLLLLRLLVIINWAAQISTRSPRVTRRIGQIPRKRGIGNLGMSWKLDPSSKLCFPNSKLDIDDFAA